jgi:hypothetical protein
MGKGYFVLYWYAFLTATVWQVLSNIKIKVEQYAKPKIDRPEDEPMKTPKTHVKVSVLVTKSFARVVCGGVRLMSTMHMPISLCRRRSREGPVPVIPQAPQKRAARWRAGHPPKWK